MAQRKTKRRTQRRTTARKKEDDDYPGWMWMTFGLAIGLSVAFAIYMKDQREAQPSRPVAQQPASMAAPMERPTERACNRSLRPNQRNRPNRDFPSTACCRISRSLFPNRKPDVSRDADGQGNTESRHLCVCRPVLSLKLLTPTDAGRNLLCWVLSQEFSMSRSTTRSYHRVRIGPINDLDALNRIRAQLRQAEH